jgi:hypothetical protein
MEISVRKKAGKGLGDGANRDQGYIAHAVKDSTYPSFEQALCGTTPGYRGAGWNPPERQGAEVTCSLCVKRLAGMEQS